MLQALLSPAALCPPRPGGAVEQPSSPLSHPSGPAAALPCRDGITKAGSWTRRGQAASLVPLSGCFWARSSAGGESLAGFSARGTSLFPHSSTISTACQNPAPRAAGRGLSPAPQRPRAASSTAVLLSGQAGTKPDFISLPTERLKYSILSSACK